MAFFSASAIDFPTADFFPTEAAEGGLEVGVMDCSGAICAFACATGCLGGCLIGGGSTAPFGGYGGVIGGAGVAIYMES